MRASLREDGAPSGFIFTTAVGSITRSLAATQERLARSVSTRHGSPEISVNKRE